MNPIHLRMVNAVIVVALFLFRAVENHIAGGYNLLFPMEIEMRLAGGDIKQLVVKASPGPVRRKPRPGEQVIDAGAPYKKGMLFVLEIPV